MGFENDAQLMEFVKSIEENEMIKAPAYMKQEILKKSNNLTVSIEAHKNKTSKNLQLFFYGLKVSAALAMELTLLMVINLPSELTAPNVSKKQERVIPDWEIAKKAHEKSNDVTGFLDDISTDALMRIKKNGKE